MKGISEVIQKSDMKIGMDYQVLTISFDTCETTELPDDATKTNVTA